LKRIVIAETMQLSSENKKVMWQAIAALRAQSDWQPMSSFPKDGNGYLVCDARTTGNHEVVFFDDERKSPWCLGTSDGPYYHIGTFTHWMPLPAPPAQENE
jgi:hypothetical protein